MERAYERVSAEEEEGSVVALVKRRLAAKGLRKRPVLSRKA